jgi:hypothetical protein
MIKNHYQLLKYCLDHNCIELWNRIKRQCDENNIIIDLNGAELNYAKLNYAELNGAKLNGAKLNYAELNGAKLNYAELNYAELNGAELNYAKLNGAKLNGAKLDGAELNGAELNNAKGLIDNINWIEKNIKKTEQGYIVYTSFNENFKPNDNWQIEEGSIIEEVVNFNKTCECACGINVGTKAWVKNNCKNQIWECLIKSEWMVGVCIPYNTDGKFRTSRLQLIKKIDIKGE